MEIELWQDGAGALWISNAEVGFRIVTSDDVDFVSDAVAILEGDYVPAGFPERHIVDSHACIVATFSLESGGDFRFDNMGAAAARYIDLRSVCASVIEQSDELAPYAAELLDVWVDDDEEVEYWKFIISQPPAAVIQRFNL